MYKRAETRDKARMINRKPFLYMHPAPVIFTRKCQKVPYVSQQNATKTTPNPQARMVPHPSVANYYDWIPRHTSMLVIFVSLVE